MKATYFRMTLNYSSQESLFKTSKKEAEKNTTTRIPMDLKHCVKTYTKTEIYKSHFTYIHSV